MKATHSKLILTLCLILNITFFMTVSEIAYGGDSEESTDEQKPRVINVHQTESTSTDDVDVLREDIQDAPPKLIDILMGRLELHLAKRRVLALDGGGMRGAFTIKVLAQLEQDTELPIGELFKGSITGTSTGSFIALGLLSSYKNGQANAGPYSAKEILEFYKTRARHMFSGCCAFDNCTKSLVCPTSISGKLRCFFKSIFSCCGCCGCCYNCGGLCGPKYTRKAIDEELQTLLGTKTRLNELLGPVQVTTYDISRGGGVVRLSSTDPQTNQYLVWQTAAASSSAPTYYPSVVIGDGDIVPKRLGVDGGLAENTPVLPAIEQAIQSTGDGADITDFTVVSIGTGQAAGAFNDEELQYAGAVSWARPAVEISMEGTSMATNLSFGQVFKHANYYRIQSALSERLLEMDNPDNVEGLLKEAIKVCGDQDSQYQKFLKRCKVEKAFISNFRRLYGDLDDDVFMEMLYQFVELVGVTHEETRLKLINLTSTHDSVVEKGPFATQVTHFFNDTRLLKALKLEISHLLKGP